MNEETKYELTKKDFEIIMKLLESNNFELSILKREIKEIHAYLYGGNIVSPMGNGSLRQRIVEGVKNALA
tara:strand:+ start:77 stop:286 length:210 start_codon:yes stop_codon:yes gene_type:complete